MNTPPSSRSGVHSTFLAGLLLALVVAAVFAGTVRAPFVFDDIVSLVINPHLEQLWPPDASLWATEQSTLAGRPVVAFTFAVDYALGELSPFGYHVVNIALHALNACLVFALLCRLLGARRTRVAFAAALLWALHPLQTEAVTYVVQRTELLSAAFILGCLLAALRGFNSMRRGGWFTLSALCCLAGVGTKESVVVAPVLVLLLDRTLNGDTFRNSFRRSRRLYYGLALSWVALGALMLQAPRGDSVGFHLGVSAWTWACTQAEVLVHYMRLALWPFPLALSYEWPLAEGLGQVWPSALAIVALLGVTVWGLSKRSPWALAGAWFFILLAPTSSVVPIVTEVAAERRMYLPLLALLVPAVLGLNSLLQTAARRLPAGSQATAPRSAAARLVSPVAVLGLALLAGIPTLQRIETWSSAEQLWRDTVEARPENSMAHFMLANTLKIEKRYEEALPFYEHALELKPRDFKTLVNMGNCQQSAGLLEAAERTQRRAIALHPEVAVAHLNLAITLFFANRAADAIPSLRRCVELEPDTMDHRCLLASTLINRGVRLPEARNQLELVLRRNPADVRAQLIMERLQTAEFLQNVPPQRSR